MSCKGIMITSFKGGVGKSTVAVNLAYFLAKNGKKTFLIDCDFRMRSLDILLGLENQIMHDAYDVMSGKVTLEEAVFCDGRTRSLYFLPAPYNYQLGMDKEAFGEMLNEAKNKLGFDYVIFDTPGSSGQEFSTVAEYSDTALVVSTHSFPSIRAAECTGSELEAMGVSDRRLIINMFDTTGRELSGLPSVVDIIDKANLRLAGIIPYDSRLLLMQDRGQLVDALNDCNISKAFSNIQKRLDGKNVPLFTGFKGINRKKLLNN